MAVWTSRKGSCRDNAPSEGFFNSLKNERVHGTTDDIRADAERDLFDYIAVFNNRRRRRSQLGDSSPIQFLEHWISRRHDRQIKAA